MPLIRWERLAWIPVYFLEWALAVETSRSVNANAIVVLEVDNLSRGGSAGLILGELVNNCDDPAMVTHSSDPAWIEGRCKLRTSLPLSLVAGGHRCGRPGRNPPGGSGLCPGMEHGAHYTCERGLQAVGPVVQGSKADRLVAVMDSCHAGPCSPTVVAAENRPLRGACLPADWIWLHSRRIARGDVTANQTGDDARIV